MKTSETKGKIAAALAKAQGMMKAATRTTENTFFKSSYAPLDSVIDAIKEALSSNEICTTQEVWSDGAKVFVITTLMHSSGEWMESERPLSATAKDALPQSIGSCTTYLRRYSLQAITCQSSRGDDDAEGAHGRQMEPQMVPRQRREAPEAEQDLAKQIAEAQSVADLDALIPHIKPQSEAIRSRLKAIYQARKDKLTSQGDAA